jgi:hypothetical protein
MGWIAEFVIQGFWEGAVEAADLLIGKMVWFTFAFFGFDAKGHDVVGVIGFCLFALSPIPVCIYCFRRVRALLNGDRAKI